LRERQEDILPLVQHFVKKYATKMGKRIIDIEPAALPRLLAYTWPGNIRELEHVIERAIIQAKGPVLEMGAAVLPVCPSPHHDADHLLTLKEVERRHIVHILKKTHRVVEGPRGAAQVLHLHPDTLRGRMRKLGIRRHPQHCA
jgi:transcriptional regulator with GAF, ATPase, and Fis domain